ncbi:helix-turn-helix domain-containing protein [Myxococcus xanthus]|uniref:helix-turn-helix domain-containing protein n=1 Tax=Myxococcus xanthus TaxID=34 RepID=UPI001162C39C|nr:helix-turn-helix domain-containing protein [Myxococcus xanthus]QDE83362.1 hypothetical protein BHS07_18340 [Myxococcus xanthus]
MGNCDSENDQPLQPRLTVVRGGASAVKSGESLLKLGEVMVLLGMGRTYVLSIKDKGLLPYVRMPNSRAIRFRRSDVEAFIARAAAGEAR